MRKYFENIKSGLLSGKNKIENIATGFRDASSRAVSGRVDAVRANEKYRKAVKTADIVIAAVWKKLRLFMSLVAAKAAPLLRIMAREILRFLRFAWRKTDPLLRALARYAAIVLRSAADILEKILISYERLIDKICAFLKKHRNVAGISLSVLICVVLGASAISTSMTYYEYSIDGKVLGVVKDRDKVSQVVEHIGNSMENGDENAVTIVSDTGAQLVIDKAHDIEVEKKIISASSGVEVDNEKEIAGKLTGLEGVALVVYDLVVDGNSLGLFASQDDIDGLLDRVKAYWLDGKDPASFKDVSFANDIQINEKIAKPYDLSDANAVYDSIMKGVKEVKEYEVKLGDTLYGIALDNDVTLDELIDLNPERDTEFIHVGDKIRLEEEKTLISVKTVEEIEYDETFKAKPEYNNTSTLYKGDEIVKSPGKSGKRHVTADVTKINGKVSEKDVLDTEVLKKPVPAKVLRGTKKLPPKLGNGYLIWPASGGVTSGFKYRWGRHHDGIDIGVRYGPVYAADGGRVVSAGNSGDGYGNKIIINHGDGKQTLYGHLSQIKVGAGDKVNQGQLIAISGNTGSSTGPHLHFEVRVNGTPRNPLNYL